MIKLYLVQQKVKFLFQELKDVKTSRCCIGILQDNQNKTHKVNQIRASALLDKKYVESKIENILDSDMLFIEGYFILSKYDIVEYLLTKYDKSGRYIAFNVSAPFICEKKREEVKNIFNFTDFIFATEEEIAKFLGVSFKSALELSNALHETLESSDKKRFLILMKGNFNYLISSYDYNNNSVITEHEFDEKSNAEPTRELSGTREGNISFNLLKNYF